MSEKSTIEWTDATWNPVRGCTKVSPGCKIATPKRLPSDSGACPVILTNRASI